MIFIGYIILIFSAVGTPTAEDMNETFGLVQSILDHFRSHSVVFIFDDHLHNSQVAVNFLRLQVLLSSHNFCFSSVSTASRGSEILKNQNGREVVIVLTPEENLIRFLEELSNATDISTYKWFLTSGKSSEILSKMKIPLNSEFIFGRRDDSGGYDLWEIYDVQPGKRLSRSMGRWVAGESLEVTPGDMFSRRRNLEGAVIKVVSSRKDPCVGKSFAVGVAMIVECIHKQIMDEFTAMLNATTEVQVVPNLDVTTIQTTDAELTLRSAPVSTFDMDTRSYIWPIFRAKMRLMTSYLPIDVEWRTYILPLSRGMWLIVVVWMLICDVVMIGVDFITKWKNKGNSLLHSLRESSYTGVFIFCSQGTLPTSNSTTHRLLFIIMLMVPGILFPGYSATLTSFLTVTLNRKPFRNLEELSRTPEYKIGFHRTLPREYMFNLNDNSPLNKALLQKVLPKENLPLTDIEGVERMCSEKFTYLTIKDTIIALKPKCRYYSLNERFKIMFTSIEIKKRSWYHYYLDRCERMVEFSGVALRLKHHVVMSLVKYKEKKITIGSNASAIKLENIILPFVVLLLGIAVSVFVLALEIVCVGRGAKTSVNERP